MASTLRRFVILGSLATVVAAGCISSTHDDALVVERGLGGAPGAGGLPARQGGQGGIGGLPGVGGSMGIAGGGGALPGPPSCPTITTTPGVVNPCGHTFGVAFSPDGALLAAGMAEPPPNVHVWSLASGQLVRDLDGFAETTYGVSFSPDGRILAAAGTNSGSSAIGDIVKLYDAGSGALLRVIPATCGFYASAAVFSPDGTLLATAGAVGPVEIWRVSDGTRVTGIPYPTSVHNVHFSPDGTRLIVGGVDERATVWTVPGGALTMTLSGIANEMADAAFSPNADQIASTSDNNNDLRVWNASTGAMLQDLPGHGAYVSRVLWLDQNRFVSDDWSGVVKTWSRDGSGAFALSGTQSTGGQGLGIALWPDHAGTTVVTGGADGTHEGFVFLSL